MEQRDNDMEYLNTITCGDNLQILKQMRGKVNLVYLDPPFGTAAEFPDFVKNMNAFDDLIRMLRPRFMILRELLSEDGSFYCHCDWRTEAHIQILLDEIFGRQNLIAKIIWQRSDRTSNLQRYIPTTYDVILYYGKTSHIKYFPQYLPYSESEIEAQYKYVEEETGKRYRLVNLATPDVNPSKLNYEFLGIKRNWRISKEKMEEEFKQGRIIQSKPDALPMRKQYMREGKLIGDVWTDINMLSAVRKEKTGYPTQKPLALLERIIEMSTEEGDIVLDPFCGSGTTLVAAERLKRKWIGIDISPTACEIASGRIASQRDDTSASDMLKIKDKRTLKELRELPGYEFEAWAIASLQRLAKGDIKHTQLKQLKLLRDKEVYSITSGSQPDSGFDFVVNSIPVMVKQKEKVDAKDIARFAFQLSHHKQEKGIFVALNFIKSAQVEAQKQRDKGLDINLVSAKDLIRK
jgi:DNA modification methylase